MKHWHGVALAAIVAFACLFLEVRPDEAHKLKILFGLSAALLAALTEVIWLLAMDLSDSKRARGEAKRAIGELHTAVASIGTKADALTHKLSERIERDENLHEVLDSQRSGFTRQEIRSKWLFLLYRLRKSYLATNYIKEIYDTDWAKAALHIQYAKKTESDLSIKKVFFFDSDDELLIFASHIERQREANVQVYFLLHSAFTADETLSKRIRDDDIPSIDFGVFDRDTVLVWQLDLNRQIIGGRVLFGREHAERHEKFFEGLFAKAKEFSKDRFAVVRIPTESIRAVAQTVDTWKDSNGLGFSGEYENMDYSLRLSDGWLAQFGSEPGTVVFAAYCGGKLVGFSLLTGKRGNDKEIYVAIRPGQLRERFGSRLTKQTMERGFSELGLERIHLKVRLAPEHRIKMYRKLGFRQLPGFKREVVNKVDTEFIEMAITRVEYEETRLTGNAGPA